MADNGIGRIMGAVLAREQRTEHAKSYIEPSLKRAVAGFADREGLTFSDAVRSALLNCPEIQHEMTVIYGEKFSKG